MELDYGFLSGDKELAVLLNFPRSEWASFNFESVACFLSTDLYDSKSASDYDYETPDYDAFSTDSEAFDYEASSDTSWEPSSDYYCESASDSSYDPTLDPDSSSSDIVYNINN